jgi:hypothetical protein
MSPNALTVSPREPAASSKKTDAAAAMPAPD